MSGVNRIVKLCKTLGLEFSCDCDNKLPGWLIDYLSFPFKFRGIKSRDIPEPELFKNCYDVNVIGIIFNDGNGNYRDFAD